MERTEQVLRAAQDDRHDVIVIGAGPAGIAAATRAAECGRGVLLLDESADVGGQIWRRRAGIEAKGAAGAWLARLERSGATVVRGASAVDVVSRSQGGFTVRGERATGAVLVDADVIVLATGARERFLPFPGWTLPGVIGVGAAQALLKSGASFSGKRVVIAGSGPLLLPVASALNADGAMVRLVAEQAARYRMGFPGTPYTLGTWVSAARGDGRVEEIDVTNGRSSRTIACDVLCAAFGLVPNTEMARLLGCDVVGGMVVVNRDQQTSRDGVYCAGEPTGIGGVELSLAEGEVAGLSCAGRRADARALYPRREMLRRDAAAMGRAFALRPELRALASADTIVCRCEDVTLGAIGTSRTMRQAKLYTRAGMGACQGRICGAALEFLNGWEPDTMRLPVEPALYSTLTADPATSAPPANQGA
jgi:thioredoxin reductase